MSISVRTRFEVFKRDRFTCAYCGRTPPEVLLHADHVVPRAAGGPDDITNLITSCQTCNQGKAARLLEEGTAPVVGRATVEELQERIEQAKAYMEAVAGVRATSDQQVGAVIDAWADAYQARIEERENGTVWVLEANGRWPEKRSIRRFLRDLPLERVLEAVDITAGRWSEPDDGTRRYFYGVCQRMIREGQSPSHALDSQEFKDLLDAKWRDGASAGFGWGRSWETKGDEWRRDVIAGLRLPTGIPNVDEAVRAFEGAHPQDEET